MRVRWLGRVPYREAWDLQRAVSRRSDHDYLLLMEHEPVYTLGRNGDAGHVLVDPHSVGADLVRVDRGGDVTYHGPGQLVGYPVVSVGPGLHQGPGHVRRVEQVVIDALVALGVRPEEVGRLPGFPGVWIGLDEAADATGSGPARPRKIAAIGVRTSRGRSTHGFALNVCPDLSMFGHIVPCGIADKAVTSLAGRRDRCEHVGGGGGRHRRRRCHVGPGRRRPTGDRWGALRSGIEPGCGGRSLGTTRGGRAVARPATGPCRHRPRGRSSRWPPASRNGCGCPRPWETPTSGSATIFVNSNWPRCARRPAARTSTSAGRMGRRPS